MRCLVAGLCLVPFLLHAADKPADDLFAHGEGISLEKAIPANERGITCLAVDDKGRVFGGTTGRAAHLFVYEPDKEEVRSLARLEGSIGFAYALIRLPDGSFIAGTQADPTGIAVNSDPKAVGHLYRFTLTGEPGASALGGSAIKVEDLGIPVPDQGIYTLAYLEKSQEIVGNTWPDGHFFVYDLKAKTFKDHGAIAGYRPFETPQHAEDVSRGTGRKLSYPRVVSRAIAVNGDLACTVGVDSHFYVYRSITKNVERRDLRLPAIPGREAFCRLLAVTPLNGRSNQLGLSSDGHLVELQLGDDVKPILSRRSIGRPFGLAEEGSLVAADVQESLFGKWYYEVRDAGSAAGVYFVRAAGGLCTSPEGMPRGFSIWYSANAKNNTGEFQSLGLHWIPRVDGQASMVSFNALVLHPRGSLYAGETDRLARLVRFPLAPASRGRKPPVDAPKEQKPSTGDSRPRLADEPPPKLPCPIVFAPEGTTTEGSGYTAIEVGKDGQVYVGSARYGDYAWLLRFDPAKKPLFMDKVVNLRELTGERLSGINTQAKIHAKIVVGPDGRVWFASKQGHEIFDTRPEYEDPNGYPGGHLCWFDPKTGFSKSVGILKKKEGLQGGIIDAKRGKIYFRSEPKNHFLVFDIATGEVQDRGHVGAACRYMAIDPNGVVYTMGRGQTLCRYDPETKYVEELRIKVASASQAPGLQSGGFAPPYVLALGPNGKLYGAGTSHPWIMEFDVDLMKTPLAHAAGSASAEVTMRNVAPAAPPGLPVQDIHAGVFGKDGRFYYPLLTTGPLSAGAKPESHLRLMRFDPATKKTETLGVPVPQFDEEKVKHTYPRPGPHKLDHIQGMAVGEDGTLFMMDIYPQLNVVWFPQLTAGK